MTFQEEMMSGAFAWRRIHSLMGLWLIVYLLEHLIVNSQAVLWIGENGSGFIRLVNSLESLPYLQVIEILFIGVPFVLHGVWGVRRALSAKFNASSLPYGRNRAFTWQRITSWILLIGVLGHVIQMRFIQMPREIREGKEIWYAVSIRKDPSLNAIAKRICVTLENDGQYVIAKAKTPGKAMLFVVRETFKSLTWCVLYSVFVLAAAFHAFNGFWTSFITWGILLSYRAQKAFLPLCWLGSGLLAFLGLVAIWGSYWLSRI